MKNLQEFKFNDQVVQAGSDLIVLDEIYNLNRCDIDIQKISAIIYIMTISTPTQKFYYKINKSIRHKYIPEETIVDTITKLNRVI